MKASLAYHISLGMAGISLASIGIARSNGLSPSAVLMILGGFGIAIISVTSIYSGSTNVSVEQRPVIAWAAIAAATLSLAGAALILLP